MARVDNAVSGGGLKQRGWLLLSNAAMMLAWIRVAVVLLYYWPVIRDQRQQQACLQLLRPPVTAAVIVSFLEVVNAVIGVTRSHPLQVLLFATVRAGVELLAAPQLPCGCWQHVLTVTTWSMGDSIRFGCFVLDALLPSSSNVAKAVRYSIGPVLFPIGAAGEMLMVFHIAATRQTGWTRLMLFATAAVWPLGFYPLMKQLLRQRRKFFATLQTTDSSSSSKGKVKSV